MPVTGIEKTHLNFLDYRVKRQKEFWPDFVEEWDKKSEGARFRSEILSLTDLWNLYVGGVPDDDSLSEESKARGRKVDSEEDFEEAGRKKTKKTKKRKALSVVPISTRFLPGRYNDQGYLHFDQWLYARDQARKELFFLCKELGLVPDVEKHIHQVVCDQFVQPDFDGVYKKGYSLKNFTDACGRQNRVPKIWLETSPYEKETLEDFGHYIPDPIEVEKAVNQARTMLLLDPRGFFKTWIDVANIVQLVINAPDARILLMSGIYSLTVEFLLMVKSKFYLPRGAQPKPFHLLFPEFVIRGVDGTSKENLRIKDSCDFLGSRLEHDPAGASVGIISIGSSLSGNHCEFLKFDDVVTDNNCDTEETRGKLKEKANGAVNLMMEWSWHDIIGTRYFPDDYYGQTYDNFKKSPSDFNLKYFKRAAWTVKPEHEELEHSNILALKEDMVDLTWPEHRSFKALRKLLAENEKKFRCQQLNQPVWDQLGVRVQFDEPDIRRQIIRPDVAQKMVTDKFAACDRGFTDKKYSDFSVIAIGGEFKKEDGSKAFVVLEIIFDRWRDPQLSDKIAEYNAKWKVKSFYVEDGPRTDLLKRDVQENYRRRVGHYASNMDWRMPDSQPGAKINRIRGLATLIKNEQLYFADGPWIDDLIFQFTKYTGERSSTTRKDDIPDAISLLTRYFRTPAIVLTPAEQEAKKKREEVEHAKRALEDHYRRVFGDTWKQHVPSPEFNVPKAPSPYDSIVNKLGLGGLFKKK